MRLFEWDENKRTSNKMKHSIDFKEAFYLSFRFSNKR